MWLDNKDICSSIDTSNYKLNFLDWKTDRILKLNDNIKNFLLENNNLNSIEDFTNFKLRINQELVEYFSEELKWETENFCDSFFYSDKNYLNDDDIKKNEKLLSLILEKNRIYNFYILSAILSWNLDSILGKAEKNDLINFIESGIIDYINQLYIKQTYEFEKDINKSINKENIWNNDLIFWTLKDGKIVSYKDFLSLKDINEDKIKELTDWNLWKYLKNFYNFLNIWETSYDKFVEIEKYSLESWDDDKSKLAFCVPIETYLVENVLVDLELELFLKNEANEYKKNSIELSNKIYWDDFNMGSIRFFISEPILSSGIVSFKNILWKAFPNDVLLEKEYWAYIYSIVSRSWIDVVIKSKEYLDKILFDKNINKENVASTYIEHVAYHEYWHSLFKESKQKSLLEETKASLFYLLYLLDEFNKYEFSESKMKDVIDFSVLEIIWKTLRKDKPWYIQYFITEKINLSNLLDSGLIYFENNLIKYDINKENFLKFLELSKEVLSFIKDTYENFSEYWEKNEKEFLDRIESKVWKYILKIEEQIK